MPVDFLNEPIISFTILLIAIFIVPPLFERLKLPGLVGLLIAGVLLGQNGLNLLNPKSETIKLLSDIGKVYLMFVAGLEIDIEQFRQTKNRSMGFGFLTFLMPLIAGIITGRLFNFSWNSSVLIGSLLASHTLLAYPIISRLGVIGNEAVTVTSGATIFTDTGALLLLAICVGIHGGDFTAFKLFTLLGGLAIYSVVILFGFNKVGKEFFRRTGEEESNQFLFILLALFLASVGAQAIGIEKIVGGLSDSYLGSTWDTSYKAVMVGVVSSVSPEGVVMVTSDRGVSWKRKVFNSIEMIRWQVRVIHILLSKKLIRLNLY
jgi:Kef-type K+ transport system membrane component KefB